MNKIEVGVRSCIARWIACLVVLIGAAAGNRILAQQQVNPRAEWFVDARFGMFIHWGVYSGAEGYWKGEKLRYDNNYAEWIKYRNRISNDEYLSLLERFDWDRIDPEEWVLLAKRAGMKYVTITAKHHDGFALWDSDVGRYDVGEFTDSRRDIVGELAAACRKHGLAIGLYYSHWIDWEHPGAWDHTNEIYPLTPEQYDAYWQEKVMPQMSELLTNYGDIGLIWFDMWINHKETIVTKEQLLQLKALIREKQPNCLVNSRLGLSVEEDPDIDFQTLADNQLGRIKREHPWQTSGTIAHSWGYYAHEHQLRSTTTLLRSLINNVSLNGNYMLNIGPRANGQVIHEVRQRLDDVGQWLEKNGEAIYGCGAFDLPSNQHDWGRITVRRSPDGGATLYLHVLNWPLNRRLPLTGVTTPPTIAVAIAENGRVPLEFEHRGALTLLKLPEEPADRYLSVLALEYPAYPGVRKDLVALTTNGGYALAADRAVRSNGTFESQEEERFGSVPAHAKVEGPAEFTWNVYVDRPQTLMVDASLSFQGEADGGVLRVDGAGQSVALTIRPTGRTVGEPNEGWQIDSFTSNRVGSLRFDAPGYYDVTVRIEPAGQTPVGFQWLWLAKE